MKVECYKVGFLNENLYLIYKDNFGIIIDPGEINKDLEYFIEKNNIKIVSILVTHYHLDHIGALEYYKNLYSVPVIDYKANKHQIIKNFNFEIIKTYGHTRDSVSFYFEKEKIMFTGDFLFKETIGNYSLENEFLMKESLRKIKTYDRDITIYPGHEESSTISNELLHNSFLKD